MRFPLDHDVPDEVGRSLRYWGYEIKHLREVLPARTSDDAIFAHAQSEGSIIVTCNRGHFLGLARQTLAQGQALCGLIILIRRGSRQAECGHLLALLRRAGEGGLKATSISPDPEVGPGCSQRSPGGLMAVEAAPARRHAGSAIFVLHVRNVVSPSPS